MQVTNIKVSAGRTFNHPFESYSNLRCDVHLDAVLSDGDDPKAATQALQAQAEELAENHKQSLLKQINNLEELSRTNSQISALEERLTAAQAQLNKLRESRAVLTGPAVVTPQYSYPAGADVVAGPVDDLDDDDIPL